MELLIFVLMVLGCLGMSFFFALRMRDAGWGDFLDLAVGTFLIGGFVLGVCAPFVVGLFLGETPLGWLAAFAWAPLLGVGFALSSFEKTFTFSKPYNQRHAWALVLGGPAVLIASAFGVFVFSNRSDSLSYPPPELVTTATLTSMIATPTEHPAVVSANNAAALPLASFPGQSGEGQIVAGSLPFTLFGKRISTNLTDARDPVQTTIALLFREIERHMAKLEPYHLDALRAIEHIVVLPGNADDRWAGKVICGQHTVYLNRTVIGPYLYPSPHWPSIMEAVAHESRHLWQCTLRRGTLDELDALMYGKVFVAKLYGRSCFPCPVPAGVESVGRGSLPLIARGADAYLIQETFDLPVDGREVITMKPLDPTKTYRVRLSSSVRFDNLAPLQFVHLVPAGSTWSITADGRQPRALLASGILFDGQPMKTRTHDQVQYDDQKKVSRLEFDLPGTGRPLGLRTAADYGQRCSAASGCNGLLHWALRAEISQVGPSLWERVPRLSGILQVVVGMVGVAVVVLIVSRLARAPRRTLPSPRQLRKRRKQMTALSRLVRADLALAEELRRIFIEQRGDSHDRR